MIMCYHLRSAPRLIVAEYIVFSKPILGGELELNNIVPLARVVLDNFCLNYEIFNFCNGIC